MTRLTNDSIREAAIYRLICGYDRYKQYKIKFPSSKIRYAAARLKNHLEFKINAITQDEMLLFLNSMNIWTEEDDEDWDSLPFNLNSLKIELYEKMKLGADGREIKDKIHQLKSKLFYLSEKRSKFDQYTKEGIIEYAYNCFIVKKTTFSRQGRADLSLIELNNVLSHLKEQRLGETDLRYLARHSDWRKWWDIKKDRVFGRDISEEQLQLLTYTNMYTCLHKHPDCPPDRIIEDDDALDGWFLLTDKNRELEQKNKKYQSRVSKHIKSEASDVFLFPQPDLGEVDIRRFATEVDDMNTGTSKLKKKKRLKQVSKADVIGYQFHDVELDIQNQKRERFIRHAKGQG